MTRSSYVMAEDPIDDLAIVGAMAEELEAYLVNNELYRTITVSFVNGDQNLQMTGGDMLTRLHRLQGERDQIAEHQRTRLDTLTQEIEQTIYSLRTRFHERLTREIKTRLDSLRWFLDDCMADQQRCHVEFPFEMRNRQRIEEALKALEYQLSPDLKKELHQIDDRIRLLAVSAPFVWEERLRPIFPADPYWYLYLRPMKRS